MMLDKLNLSSRSWNCLRRRNIETVEQLTALTDEELLQLPGVGVGTVQEIRAKLQELEDRKSRIEDSVFSPMHLCQESEELRALILAKPGLPIAVLAGEDANRGGDFSWAYCSHITFGIDEILDCDYCDSDDTVFTDRERLKEKISDDLADDYYGASEEEFQAAIERRLAELEPYWKKVIAIYATN